MSDRPTAFYGLPEIFFALMGDIPERFHGEPLATCGDCAMKPRPGLPHDVPWAPTFLADSRCCTYHPDLPAYAIGRILRDGGLGAERIRERMSDRDGVLPGGIRAPKARRAMLTENVARFGQDDILQCPYFSREAAEGRGCTVHAHREAVCRTWHCRLTGGVKGQAAWMGLKELLSCVEDTLVAECLNAKTAPPPEADAADWERWYLWCAEHVDALIADADRLRGEQLSVLLEKVRARTDERDAPLPEIVIPNIRSWYPHKSGVTLVSWSTYDPFEAPPWIFELLSRLDGKTPWRKAKTDTEVLLRAPVGDDLIASMFRRSLLGPPEHLDAPPGMSLAVLPTRSGENP